jgi:eukaryotic-like serine/threonine-protein kinase
VFGVTKARDFVGPYRLTRLIRTGHSCYVWEAVKEASGERFALKMLRSELAKDRDEISHLKHEWEVAKEMHHPNIIRFYEFLTQYHSPFLVLELYSALNLKLVLREGPEPLAYLAEKIIQQTAHGLHYMHQRGWIHCDIKPDNMLVDDDGNVKLIDFTISQRPKRSLLSFLGFKQSIRGTRSYMSPEQIRGETLDGRSDVYSLGCVIFELLSGRPPFTGSSPNELLEKHLRASVPSVVVHNKEVTKECADLIRRMMGKKRETRPESMWEVMQEFRNIQIFSKKPQPPEYKLSQLDTGPVTDADALKQLPRAGSDEIGDKE